MSESTTYHKFGRGVQCNPGARTAKNISEEETWELNYLHWECGWGSDRLRRTTKRSTNVLAKILAVTYKDYLEIKRVAEKLGFKTPDPKTYRRQ